MNKFNKRMREVLGTLLTKTPPLEMIKAYYHNECSDELQIFCFEHCITPWQTGIGIIEGAEHMVREAIQNGNLTTDAGIRK